MKLTIEQMLELEAKTQKQCENRLAWELQWVRDNVNLYASKEHAERTIKAITKRYRILDRFRKIALDNAIETFKKESL